MKKYLLLLVTFSAATALGIGLRHVLHGPAAASVQRDDPAEPLTPTAARPTNLDRAGVPTTQPKELPALCFAAARATSEGDVAELLLARIAYDSGAYLLTRAQAAPGNTRLLQQSAQHLRACLAHEGSASDPGPLFREARGKLELAERLLAEASRPAARKEGPPAAKVAPKVSVQPPPAPTPVVRPPAPRMVGPDGTPYRRVTDRP